jgi:hypothetical protein
MTMDKGVGGGGGGQNRPRLLETSVYKAGKLQKGENILCISP